MKNSLTRNLGRLLMLLIVVLVASFAVTAWSGARTSATSVNIVNNSSRAIVNVYLSHVGADDWSGNQLGNATIGSGQSINLTNVACDAQQIRVIGEDQDGCFVSTNVSCGQGSTWTITNDTSRDCGQ